MKRTAAVLLFLALCFVSPVLASSPFSSHTGGTVTIEPFSFEGRLTIKLLPGCGDGEITIFSATSDDGDSKYGPVTTAASRLDCLKVELLPTGYGDYSLSSITVSIGQETFALLDGKIRGDVDELVARNPEKYADTDTKGFDWSICSHPEWFEELPQECETFADEEAVVVVKAPLTGITTGVSISTNGHGIFQARSLDSADNPAYSVYVLTDDLKGLGIGYSYEKTSIWTWTSLEGQTAVINGSPTKLGERAQITGRLAGRDAEPVISSSDEFISFLFPTDMLTTLWCGLPDGTAVSWGGGRWNTSPLQPAQPFTVPAGEIVERIPEDTGLQKLLSAGNYQLAFSGPAFFTGADISLPDSLGNTEFDSYDIDNEFEQSPVADKDELFVKMVTSYWANLEEGGTAGKGCYLVPVGITKPGVTVYRETSSLVTTYFIVAYFCEDGSAPSPDVFNRMVVSIRDSEGKSSVLDMIAPPPFEREGDLPDLQGIVKIFWTKRVWNVNETSRIDFSILVGAQGDEGVITSGSVDLLPPTGEVKAQSTHYPAGFTRKFIVENGSLVLKLEFRYEIARRNDYTGPYSGYVFLDHDGDGFYEDVREMKQRDDGDVVFLSADVFLLPEPEEREVNFAVAFYDSRGEHLPGYPGIGRFKTTVPALGSRAVAPAVYAFWTGSSVRMGFSVAYGPSVNYSTLSVYAGVYKHGRGVVYLNAQGPFSLAVKDRTPIYLTALNKREGEVYADFTVPDVVLSDFWGFRFIGDYLFFVEVEENGDVIAKDYTDFHIK